MLSISQLRRYPYHFQTLTGLTIAQFDHILNELTPTYHAVQQQKQERDDRLRSVGAGRPFVLPLEDRLLIGLVHLHLHPSFRLLSDLFGMDRGNIHREIHQRLLPVLNTVSPLPLRDVLPQRICTPGNKTRSKNKQLRTLQQLIAAFPELQEVLLDASEHQLLHPSDKRTRHRSGSGKTDKTTITNPPLRLSPVSMQKLPWLEIERDRAYEGATPGLSPQEAHPVSHSA